MPWTRLGTPSIALRAVRAIMAAGIGTTQVGMSSRVTHRPDTGGSFGSRKTVRESLLVPAHNRDEKHEARRKGRRDPNPSVVRAA